MKIPKARKLPSGMWRVQITVGDKRLSVTADTKNKAEADAYSLKYTETVRKAVDSSLGELIDEYISERNKILSPSTIRGYKTIKKTRFQSVMDIPVKNVKSWQRIVNAEDCSPKTLKNAWGFVASVLRNAGIDPGPVRLPMIIPKELPFLDPDQVKIFVRAIEDDKYEIPLLLCLHGLRRSEMLALDKSDVDDVIHVRGAVVLNTDNKFIKKNETKNVASTRNVPVFTPRLTGLVAAAPEGRLVTCNPSQIYKRLVKICKENDLPEIGLHGLRHSFASLCYHLNISELQAMKFGGWNDLTVMRKIYTHLAKSDTEKAAQSLKDFFV